jgi:hypothetical protein
MNLTLTLLHHHHHHRHHHHRLITPQVQKVFSGGVQRVAQLTVKSYEDEKERAREAELRKQQRKEEERLEEEKQQLALASEAANAAADGELTPRKRYDGDASITPFWDEDDEDEGKLTDPQRIEERSEEILRQVYAEFEARLYVFCYTMFFLLSLVMSLFYPP